MELIITEKDNAARRIADILSDGSAGTDRRNGVNVYQWDSGETVCVGLSGHVVAVDFPPEYDDWRDVRPVELLHADIEKRPTQENIVRTLQELAREADEAVIATDYDREGELIGKEAYELVTEVASMPIERVRFSSITEREVKEAFANPDELDFDLAAAGEARQIIDLLWGAALTRFLSLSAGQLGEDFISVGRVQSPTLKLIVDREREIEAFEPDDYWELFADLHKDAVEFEAQYFFEGEDGTENERVWNEPDADDAYAALSQASSATVTGVRRRTRTDDPPAPFNTTQFIRAASSLGYGAGRAMSIAEELYTAGYITYPRTDNTVYPEDLDPEDLLATLADTGAFGEDAASLLNGDGDIDPTRGETETTDHPPIHPTGEVPGKAEVGDDEWEVYELVVRRFLATCAEPAEWEHLRVTAEANGCQLKANGKRLLEPGYLDVYPYASSDENLVPDVEEGEELDLTDARLEAKQTQPPRRRGQSRLIETMEQLGVGTKCLTEDTQVLVRDDEGDVVRRPVSELFESERLLLADGDREVDVAESGRTLLSFQERTGEVVPQWSRLVSERPLEPGESVLRFETTNGSFSVTDDHPLYVREDGHTSQLLAREVDAGDRLLGSRPAPGADRRGDAPTVATWEEFASACDKESKLYGTDCADAVGRWRETRDATQADVAERADTHRANVSAFENDRRDVPVWILGALDIRPDRLHGLNYDTAFSNPFPMQWTPELARVLGHLLGDGSIHVDTEENVMDVRYHNTDRALIDRFVSDIEHLFDVSPTVSERAGREEHHLTKYQVNLPTSLGRVLRFLLDGITEDGRPRVPDSLEPHFVGALFDDEGHLSRERKAYISNTDHELLSSVAAMLGRHGVETKLAADQHKLHIRGRKNLERFLDTVPIGSDWKFYRGLDGLRSYDVTEHKARVLEVMSRTPATSEELSDRTSASVTQVQSRLRELREEGYVEKHVSGSNRSKDGNRTVRYSTDRFRGSVYATVLGRPAETTVRSVEERAYDGSVYDLSAGDDAPNFAVAGGTIVHNSTRHNTIEKLYDRGYIEDDPPRPTRLAMAVVEAAEEFADLVVDEGMTQQLERDMTAIADGEATLDDVTDESREMLGRVFDELHESREAIGDHLREALKDDKRLGPCPECGETLIVRRSRRGSYFVGCEGFPDCENTYQLPSSGEPTVMEASCEEHGLRHVKMLAGRSTFVHGCPICKAEEADAQEDEVIGACPECGEEHGGELAIKHLQSGSRLVGCVRYPDCDYSLPLPRRGDIEVTDEFCPEHDLPELVIHDGDDEPWELGCPICNFEEFQARRQKRDLDDLDGVGEKTAAKLADADIESLSDLQAADPDDVASQVSGVSADRVRDWQEQVESAG